MMIAIAVATFAVGVVIGGVVVGACAASGRISEEERVAAQVRRYKEIADIALDEQARLRHQVTALRECLDRQREKVAT